MTYKVIPLEQGTVDWLNFRKDKIGGSDIPVIMEVSSHKKLSEFLQEKITGQSKVHNEYTQKLFKDGHEWEEKLRPVANDNLKMNFKPVVLQSKENEKFFCSYDGIDFENESVLEIKSTVSKEKLELISHGVVPADYLYQIQWQLFISGFKNAQLYVVNRNTGAVTGVPVFRNDKLINDILEKVNSFLEKVNQGIRPIQDVQGERFIKIKETKKVIDEYKKLLKVEEDNLKKLAEGLLNEFSANKLSGEGMEICWQERKGSVQYDQIPELKGIDLEQYRGEGSRFVKITVKKSKGNNDSE